ncbi:MAG: TRAM domain-containing protein [Ruminococcus sp.]
MLVEGESKREGFLMGKDLAFIIVEFPGDPSLIGQFVSVRVTQTRNWAVEGVLVTPEEEQQ